MKFPMTLSPLRQALYTGILGASLIFAPALPVFAEGAVKSDNMVVSATKTERDLSQISSSLSVVTAEEIKRHGYTSVADILQDVPGVEVFDQSLAGAKRINIRGESGARVLILVDGQKITEQKSMDGAPLLIDPSQIERVEVIKGPASVLYGSEAIGGAVNIITKKGGDKPLQGSASVTYNSATQGFQETLSLYGSTGNFSYRASGTHSDQGNRETPNGELKESDSESTAGTLFVGYDTDKISLGIRGETYDSEVDSPPTTTGGNPFNLNLPEWSRNKVAATMDIHQVSPLIPKVHVDAYTQKTRKEFEQRMSFSMGPMTTINQAIDTDNDQTTTGANIQMDLTPGSDHYIVMGYSFTKDSLDADTSISYPPGTPPMLTNKTYFHEAGIDTHALFIQDEWVLPSDLMLTLGARQTWVESELEKTDDPNSTVGSVDDDKPVFSAGLTWNGVKGLTLRGHVAQGYRFPDLSKLFIGTSHGGSTTLANQNLKPETSNNYEIGARYNASGWVTDLTAFFSDADDYITTKSLGGNTYQYTNVNRAKTHGVEASLSRSFEELHLTPYLSGTWMKRKFETETRSTENTSTPEFSGRLGLKYERTLANTPALVWADLWVRAATDSDDEEKQDDGTYKVVTTDGWETLNLAVGTSFGDEGQYRFSLNLNNILDKEYTTARNSLEEAGFHAVARMDVAF